MVQGCPLTQENGSLTVRGQVWRPQKDQGKGFRCPRDLRPKTKAQPAESRKTDIPEVPNFTGPVLFQVGPRNEEEPREQVCERAAAQAVRDEFEEESLQDSLQPHDFQDHQE